MLRMSDVVVIGGGVIGLSLAWELAGQGRDVTVLEQGQVGQEASWAGAGMLPPGNLKLASDGEPTLRSLSHQLWSDWSASLLEATGIDNGYRNCSAIEVSLAEPLDAEIETWRKSGVRAELLQRDEMRENAAAISDEIAHAYRLPEFSQVRNPRHLKALIAACRQRRVRIVEGRQVFGWDVEQGRAVAAKSANERYSADQFVITAGAWSQSLLKSVGCTTDIKPIRGQIALLKTKMLPFDYVIELGSRYLVPRDDGRILVGSTEENVGFVKQNTAAGVQGLLELATRLVPQLEDAELERCWSGFRPGTSRAVPFIGAVPEIENLFVAAGHFRSGLQMSPGTTLLIRELMLGQKTSISPEPFAIGKATCSSP
jgi:glycine oxidase